MKRKENKKKINAPTFEPRPAKSYFIANGRFSHSGSQIVIRKNNMKVHRAVVAIKKRVLVLFVGARSTIVPFLPTGAT